MKLTDVKIVYYGAKEYCIQLWFGNSTHENIWLYQGMTAKSVITQISHALLDILHEV